MELKKRYGVPGRTFRWKWVFFSVLILSGLIACGKGSTGDRGMSPAGAATPQTLTGPLVISAALLDLETGSILIDGRNFTGGSAPVVTLNGTGQTVTDYSSTEITASYSGPAEPVGALLLTVQRGPDRTDYDSFSIVPSEFASDNQLVIWSLRVEMLSGMPWLVIHGNNFDNGGLPVVSLGDHLLAVTEYNANSIRAVLPDTAILAEGDLLSVQTGGELENWDVHDLNIDFGTQVPPEGDCFPCWSEGPEDTDPWSGGSVWYEPLYYQLEHDYTVDMPSYFSDSGYMPLGYSLFTDDYKDYLLDGFPSVAVAYTGWDYIAVEPGGMLVIRKGYRWDGPTTSPLPYSPKIVHASMVHDAIYDLMRRGDIPRDFKPATDEGFWHRAIADCLLYMISKDEGYSRVRAFSDFVIVRDFGWGKTNDSMPEWKEHAVAEAGPDQENLCATPTGAQVDLDGSASRHALSWTWTENGSLVASGPQAAVLLAPGTHTITLAADDPGAESRGLHHYADTDDVVIDVKVDSVPPAIQVPEQGLTVPNDPGLCSAVVPVEVTGTDECGEPQVLCDPPLGDPFPVGSREVVCTAVDGAGNTASASFQVTVKDVEPPVIAPHAATPVSWPPNHQYVTLTAADLVKSVSDNCGETAPVSLVIARAASSEPDNGTGVGDGHTTADIQLAPDGASLQLRAERQGTGGGRFYTVTLKATDGAGNTVEETVELAVPHSN